MCKIIEDRGKEMAEKAAKKAKHDALIEVATNLIKMGIGGIEDIADATGLPINEVRALGEQHSPAAGM